TSPSAAGSTASTPADSSAFSAESEDFYHGDHGDHGGHGEEQQDLTRWSQRKRGGRKEFTSPPRPPRTPASSALKTCLSSPWPPWPQWQKSSNAALKALESAGVEAVESAALGEVARQRAQIALGTHELREPVDLARLERTPPERGTRAQQGGDARRSLLQLERAHGIDEEPARADHGQCRLEEAVLLGRHARHIGGRLEMAYVGMTPERARGRAGRVEEDGVRRLLGPPQLDVRGDELGTETEPREIFREPPQAMGGALERRHLGAGKRQLRRLAARCRAEIEDAFSRDIAEHARRQCRRRVLHPPGPLGEAGQRSHVAARPPAQRSRRQELGLELGGPAFRVRLD